MSDQIPKRNYLTIVSGLPRSGTSMMMRLLEAGGLEILMDQIRRPDEDNPRGYYEFEPVKRTKQDPSWVRSSDGKVVKMVYRLLYDLPDERTYRVLFTKRRLSEVYASQNVMLERHCKNADPMDEAKFCKLFRTEIDKVKHWLDGQPNFKTLEVDYNQTLEDPAPTIEAIDQFLDGGLDHRSMLGVIDKGLYRQRQ